MFGHCFESRSVIRQAARGHIRTDTSHDARQKDCFERLRINPKAPHKKPSLPHHVGEPVYIRIPMLVMRTLHKPRRVGKVLEFRTLGLQRHASFPKQRNAFDVTGSFCQFPFQSERLAILWWVPHPRCPGCRNRTALLGHDSTTSTQAEKSSRCRRKSEHIFWTYSEQVAHGSSAAAAAYIAICKFPFCKPLLGGSARTVG